MTAKKSYIKTVAATSSLWFVFLGAAAFISTFFRIVTGTTEPTATELLYRIVFLSTLLPLLFFLKHGNFQLFHRFIANSFEDTRFFRPLVLTLSIMFVLCLFAWLAGLVTFRSWGTGLFTPGDILSRIVTVWLLSHFISAVAEELFYRGILLNHVQSVFNHQLLSVTFTAFLFSVGHFHYRTLTSFIIAFIAGLVLGFFYLKFRSVTGAVGIHFGYNLFNNLIISDPSNGILVPYLINLDFSITGFSTVSWMDVLNIAAWLTLLLYVYLRKSAGRNSTHYYHPAFDASLHKPNQKS